MQCNCNIDSDAVCDALELMVVVYRRIVRSQVPSSQRLKRDIEAAMTNNYFGETLELNDGTVVLVTPPEWQMLLRRARGLGLL